MKYALLFLLLLTIAGGAFAQRTVEGYYITQENDSVTVQMKVPAFLLGGINFKKLRKGVEAMDSLNGAKPITPVDVKRIGFVHKNDQYQLVSKPEKGGSLAFLQPVIVGPKASLYQYDQEVSSGMNHTTTQEFYTFERQDGTHLFLTNFASLSTFKEKLGAFYGSSPEVQQLINSSFEARRHIQRDIRKVVEAVNKS
ncbi:hypothetical protein HB364_21740 [Pseudoflavitalea sp. X16]|uniref:hypothetical protein n=1 Tax=Paraflavitalea devenefica TaxID=2716334 RepID=UPI001422543D|nr:hypothetical protein [Paraflavitalea devenefica]NII27720.1 hypothetical protein [Paraflavitalea devenefica]